MRTPSDLSREAALAVLRGLAVGLEPDDSARLLERASSHDRAEMLRSLLVEIGSRALLAERRP